MAGAEFLVGGCQPRRGGANLVGGCQPRRGQTPDAAVFRKICQNKRIGTLRRRAPGAPPGSATGNGTEP